jgi:hypothetical protein
VHGANGIRIRDFLLAQSQRTDLARSGGVVASKRWVYLEAVDRLKARRRRKRLPYRRPGHVVDDEALGDSRPVRRHAEALLDVGEPIALHHRGGELGKLRRFFGHSTERTRRSAAATASAHGGRSGPVACDAAPEGLRCDPRPPVSRRAPRGHSPGQRQPHDRHQHGDAPAHLTLRAASSITNEV